MGDPIGALFLDTCILLNRILGEDINRTKKLFTDMNKKDVLCFLSESVDIECNVKIMNTINFIGATLRDFFIGALQYLLSEKGRNIDDVFEDKDIKLIEDIFITIQDSDVLSTPARNIEEHIIQVTERKIENGEKFSFRELVIGMTTEILRLSNMLQDKYENIFLLKKPEVKIYSERPDPNIVSRIDDSNKYIHSPDTVHLASVYRYKEKEGQNVVFVTVDNGILRNRNMLHRKFQLIVSDPLYAIHKFL